MFEEPDVKFKAMDVGLDVLFTAKIFVPDDIADIGPLDPPDPATNIDPF